MHKNIVFLVTPQHVLRRLLSTEHCLQDLCELLSELAEKRPSLCDKPQYLLDSDRVQTPVPLHWSTEVLLRALPRGLALFRLHFFFFSVVSIFTVGA